MLSFLYGKIVDKSPTSLILDVNHVGYALQVTLNCSKSVGAVGDDVKILTHLHVREDNLQLFGFISKDERELFLQLITTPGIGPKKALAILSGSSVEDLQSYIVNENIEALTMLPGVGKKTAQRLIVDLKEKIAVYHQEHSKEITDMAPGADKLVEEATLALMSLGYQRAAALKAINAILKLDNSEIGLEDLIKHALRKL